MKTPFRIGIIDDHPIVRHGLAQLVEMEDDMTICAEASTGQEAIEAIEQDQPDVVLVDLELEGASGLEVVKTLRALYPDLPTLVLSMHDENLYAERALRAGAKGYVMKQERPEQVLEAIRTVLRGDVAVSPHIASKLLKVMSGQRPQDALPLDTLSDRELEVLRLIGTGYRTRHIAEKLCLSPKTIEAYKARLKKKLMLRDASELARYASEWAQSMR